MEEASSTKDVMQTEETSSATLCVTFFIFAMEVSI